MKEGLLLDNEYIIMSEVSENKNITQRELSKKLGVSVSTVNILMNKMIQEGLIKMTQVSQKQVLYMLTPVGMMEKAKKTVRYLKGHYRVIYKTKEMIKSFLDKLIKENDLIYVMMSNDEMGEILNIAVHEYTSKHSKANIVMIQSVVDIDFEDNKSIVLLHMTDELALNEYDINDNKVIQNIEIINLADIL